MVSLRSLRTLSDGQLKQEKTFRTVRKQAFPGVKEPHSGDKQMSAIRTAVWDPDKDQGRVREKENRVLLRSDYTSLNVLQGTKCADNSPSERPYFPVLLLLYVLCRR